jgi:predicted nucleic acid-binding protein
VIVYLDASALVKLVQAEPESPALREALHNQPARASSEIARVEVTRAVRRGAPNLLPRAEKLLNDLNLIVLTRELQDAAGAQGPPKLRSLDAIHLASALSLSDELGPVIAYDRRLITAARAAGLDTLSPGWACDQQ